jgi:hypothetical protein
MGVFAKEQFVAEMIKFLYVGNLTNQISKGKWIMPQIIPFFAHSSSN